MSDFLLKIVAQYEKIRANVVDEFGINGVYILFVFAIFLVIIIIIYIKSIIDTFKSGQEIIDRKHNISSTDFTENFAEIINDNDSDKNQLDMEIDDFSSEEELSRSIVQISAVSDDILNTNRDYEELKNKVQKKFQLSNQKFGQLKTLANHSSDSSDNKNDTSFILTDEQKKSRDLHDLITMILNLLGRKISSSKIAQAIFFHNQEKFSEQEVMQIIQTLRDFIGLCNSGHLDVVPQRMTLPSSKDALYSLAHGNVVPCLLILQSYLNFLIEQSEQEHGIIKDMTCAQAANCACLMGNIACLTDLELAHNSYELATELSPQSTNAWNNLADLYLKENKIEKAMIAYQNVLDLGNNIMYAWQISNAQGHLADYYDKLGVETKANSLKEESQNFYIKSGIRMPLTVAENAAFDVIYAQKDNNLEFSLDSLLLHNFELVR